MQKPNLNKIIADNLDKAKFQTKSNPSLRTNGWLNQYKAGGVTTLTTKPPTPYQPSQTLNNAKAILSALDASTGFSANPYAKGFNFFTRVANSALDGYTALRYAIDGQGNNAMIDGTEALLDLLPYRKGKRVGLNLSKTNPNANIKLSKLDKSLNNTLKVAKAGATADDFMHSTLGMFLFGDPDSQLIKNKYGGLTKYHSYAPPRMNVGGEPCYDAQGKVIPCPETTYTHERGTGGLNYSPVRTVSPYLSNRDIRRYTQAPTSGKDVNFIANYGDFKRSFGKASEDYNPTSVPYEGSNHWNINRFIVDPHLNDAFGDLNVNASTPEERRASILADMYKYNMLQDPNHRGKAFRKAKRFVRREIDPMMNGAFLNDFLLNQKGTPNFGLMDPLNTFDEQNPLINLNQWNRGVTQEEDMKKQHSDYNPAEWTSDRVKNISMDYLRNYKKMSRRDAKKQWKTWEEDAAADQGRYNYEISNPNPTRQKVASPKEWANLSDEERFYREQNLPEVNEVGWNIDYKDTSGKSATKHFATNKEAEQFFNTTPGEKTKYSDVSSYEKKKYGGWLDEYNTGGQAEKICYDENGYRVPCVDEAVPIEYTFDKNDPNLKKHAEIKNAEKMYITAQNEIQKKGVLSEDDFHSIMSKYYPYFDSIEKYSVDSPIEHEVARVSNNDGSVEFLQDRVDFPVEKEYRFLDPSNMHSVFGPSQSIIGFTKSNGDFYPVKGSEFSTKKEDLEFLKNQHALDVYLGERSLHRAGTKKFGGDISIADLNSDKWLMQYAENGLEVTTQTTQPQVIHNRLVSVLTPLFTTYPKKVKHKPKRKPEPTLKPRPFVPATKIPMGEPAIGMQIQQREMPRLNIPPIQLGQYNVDYVDPTGDEKRLKELGSDAFTAMQPFYETVFEAGNKYANPETGVTSRLNSLRASMKGLIKHPEVIFMKRHQLPSELITRDANKNPYHVQGFTTAGGTSWEPTDWAEPRRERNTGEGWQNFKMKLKERSEERRNRRDRGRTDCYSGNCTEEEMQDQAKYGGGLLSRTVTCSNCGHSWKGVDGGEDVMTCHKCGGMIKMKEGGVTTQTTAPPRKKQKKRLLDDKAEGEQWLRDYYNSPRYKQIYSEQVSPDEASITEGRQEQMDNLDDIKWKVDNKTKKGLGYISRNPLTNRSKLGVNYADIDRDGEQAEQVIHHEMLHHLNKEGKLIPKNISNFLKSIRPVDESGNVTFESTPYYKEEVLPNLESKKDDVKFLDNVANEKWYFDYFNTQKSPDTEAISLFNDFKYEAKKLGVFDPFTEEFTDKHYDKMVELMKDEKNREKYYRFNKLRKWYKKEDIIKGANTVVKNNNNKQQTMAKYGGWLDNYDEGGQTTNDCPDGQIKVDGRCVDKTENVGGTSTLESTIEETEPYVQTLPGVTITAKKLTPKHRSLLSYINPLNWGLHDYSKSSTFQRAYRKAKDAGDRNFMYGSNRYSTAYAGTPAQEMEQYGITADQRVFNPSQTRLNLGNLNTTSGYDTDLSDVFNTAITGKNKKGFFDDVVKKEHDAFRLYLGLPQEQNSFKPSTFKEGAYEIIDYDKNFPEVLSKRIEDLIINSGGSEEESKSDEHKAGKRSMIKPWGDIVMGKHTVKRGKDEKGDYIEYIDNWDLDSYKLNPVGDLHVPVGGAADVFNKPFPIYGRIYYKKDDKGRLIRSDLDPKNVQDDNVINRQQLKKFLEDQSNQEQKFGGSISMARGGSTNWLTKYDPGGETKSTPKCGPNQIYLEGTGCIDIASPMYRELYESGKLVQQLPDGSVVFPTSKPFVVNSKRTEDQKRALQIAAQKGFIFEQLTGLKPITSLNNPTDNFNGISIQETQRQNVETQNMLDRNRALAERTFIGPGAPTTKESEERRKRLTKQSIYGLPNVKYDEATGTTSAINPNMTYEGEPANFMGERQQKSVDHIMGALEAAGYITGAGELASAGYKILKPMISNSMESALLKFDKVLYPTRAYRASLPSGNLNLYSNLAGDQTALASKVFNKGDFATKDLKETFQYLRGIEGSTAETTRPGLLTGQGMNLTEYKIPFWKKNVSFDKDVITLKGLQGTKVNPNEYLVPGKSALDKFLYPRRTNFIQAVPEHLKSAETIFPGGHSSTFYTKGTAPVNYNNVIHASEPYKYVENQLNAVTGHEMPITFDYNFGKRTQANPILGWNQPQFAPNSGVGNFRKFGDGSFFLPSKLTSKIGNFINPSAPEHLGEAVISKKQLSSYNPKTGLTDVYSVDVPDRIVPGRSFEDVSHKMKNLRKDLGISRVEDFLYKRFPKLSHEIPLDKGTGMLIDPETGRLFDSNTRYWLNRQYGHTPSVESLFRPRESYIAQNYGKLLFSEEPLNIKLPGNIQKEYGGSTGWLSKYDEGGEPCPEGQVRVNGQCVSISSEAYKKAYESGLTGFGTAENPLYATPDRVDTLPAVTVKAESSYKSLAKNKDWFDSHATWTNTGDTKIKGQDWDDYVRQQVMTGRFGLDSKTGALIKLPKNEWTNVSDEYKEQSSADWGKKNMQQRFASKTSAGKSLRKKVAAKSMEEAYRNPIMYAPAIIAGAPFVAGALATSAPIVTAALNTPLYAGANAALTTGNLLNLGFGMYSANEFANPNSETRESFRTAYNNPTFGNVTNATTNALFNTLGVVASPGMGTVVKTLAKTPGALKNAYNTVATGESILPVAWKSPAVGLSQEASADMFKGLMNSGMLTDAERALIVEYQHNSRPFTGRDVPINSEKRNALNNIIQKYNLNVSNNAIATRRFNPTNQSLGANWQGNKLNLGDRPTSFSAGVGLDGYGSGAVDRLVIPNRYLKKMGNNFIVNQYSGLSDEAMSKLSPEIQDFAKSWLSKESPLISSERELIGSGLDLKRMGKVKNDIGGYDWIVKPKSNNKYGSLSINNFPVSTPINSTAEVAITKQPIESFQMQEFPGLHIKSTMTGSPLEKQLSKTGEIDINNINAYIGKADVPQQDKYIIEKVLNEKFAGKKKINYNEFRQAVQNELVPLEREIVPNYLHTNHGLKNLGFSGPKAESINTSIFFGEEEIRFNTESIAKIDAKLNRASELGLSEEQITKLKQSRQKFSDIVNEAEVKLAENKKLLENLPLENETIIFKNTEGFGKGNTKHFDDPATLGHTRIYVSPENPETMHVLESQSDFYQMEGSSAFKRYSGEGAEERISSVLENRLQSLEDNKKVLADLEYKFKNNIPDDQGYPIQEFQVEQFKGIVNDKERQILLSKGELKNWKQKMYLGKGHQERLLQENINYAVEKGMTKMRYPTKETAYKIQDYRVLENIDRNGLPAEELANLDKQLNAQQTILKKYDDAPKMIKKTLGVEVKTVTDGKGNTWYEFDIPESFRSGKGEMRAFARGGSVNKQSGWLNNYATAGMKVIPELKKGGEINWLNKYK